MIFYMVVPTVKFRSPGTGGFDANYAWNVDKSGNIPLFSDHENSYGHTFIRSPAIDTEADSIFYVATDGGAYISDYISTYSYGSPYTDYVDYGYLIYPSGDIYASDGDYVGGSYGTCSPGTNYSRGAWSILSSGDSENTSSGYNIDLSYGQSYIIKVRFTARIISVLYMKGAIKYEIYQGHEITRYS